MNTNVAMNMSFKQLSCKTDQKVSWSPKEEIHYIHENIIITQKVHLYLLIIYSKYKMRYFTYLIIKKI